MTGTEESVFSRRIATFVTVIPSVAYGAQAPKKEHTVTAALAWPNAIRRETRVFTLLDNGRLGAFTSSLSLNLRP